MDKLDGWIGVGHYLPALNNKGVGIDTFASIYASTSTLRLRGTDLMDGTVVRVYIYLPLLPPKKEVGEG